MGSKTYLVKSMTWLVCPRSAILQDTEHTTEMLSGLASLPLISVEAALLAVGAAPPKQREEPEALLLLKKPGMQ